MQNIYVVFTKFAVVAFTLLVGIACSPQVEEVSSELNRLVTNEDKGLCDCQSLKLSQDEWTSIQNMAYFESGSGSDRLKECAVVAQSIVGRMCYSGLFGYFAGQAGITWSAGQRLPALGVMTPSQYEPQRAYQIQYADGSRKVAQNNNRRITESQSYTVYGSRGQVDTNLASQCGQEVDKYLRNTHYQTRGGTAPVYFAASTSDLQAIGVLNVIRDWNHEFKNDGTGNIFGNYLPVPQCDLSKGTAVNGSSSSGTTPVEERECPASAPDSTFQCDADDCNVRLKPGSSADNPPIGKATRRDVYPVLAHACQKSSGQIWYKINYNGNDAWVWSLRTY